MKIYFVNTHNGQHISQIICVAQGERQIKVTLVMHWP